jgi:hypothetical protein
MVIRQKNKRMGNNKFIKMKLCKYCKKELLLTKAILTINYNLVKLEYIIQLANNTPHFTAS